MSWKSLVTASLLCVLASPAFAVPQLEITSGGLDANGNWVWNVRIAPTSNTTPMATELGFATNKNIKGVTNASATSWDTNTPGNSIFGWETPYNTPAKPEGIEVNAAVGTPITNAAALPATGGHPFTLVSPATPTNQIFAALGSADNLTLSSPAGTTIGASVPYLTILTAGPTNSSLNSSVTLSGSYSGSGHVAEITSGSNPTNYKGFTGTATRTIVNGDINLDGKADGTDFGIFGGNYAPGVSKTGGWKIGDFNGDGKVDGTDFGIFGGAYNPSAPAGGVNTPLTVTGVADTPGAGAGLGSAAVPEPASIALMGLALLGGMGLIGRKR